MNKGMRTTQLARKRSQLNHGTTQTGTSSTDASSTSAAIQRTNQDAVASVEAKEGRIVLWAGLLPICRHCFKPRMNCDCDVLFEPFRIVMEANQ